MSKQRMLVPQPKLDLPEAGSADWFLTPAQVLEKRAEFVRQHGEYLQARAVQATAAEKLAAARFSLGLAVARLGALPEVVRDEHLFAASQRAQRQRIADLNALTEALRAQAVMLDAKHKRDALLPKPPPTTPVSPSTPGLSIPEIDELLRAMNDISPDLRTTLGDIFAAYLDEKKKR